MFIKILFASLLLTPELLISAGESQVVPDIDTQRYSQTAPGDGMVQATQQEVATQPEEVNHSDDDDNDFAVVPQG